MLLKLHYYPAKVCELNDLISYSIDTRMFESGATTVLIES